ncbi:MAG: hypothetical protein JNK41_14345 [Saprospiraceae bacterium]|jgi:hypothetical protein|nr:hypothetical protein [Saprospiraceae bacterium]
MKFKSLVFAGIALLALSVTACKSKPKLMSPEEVTKMVDEKVAKEKEVLGPELDKLCVAQTPQLVQAAVDQLVAEAQAAQTAPAQ